MSGRKHAILSASGAHRWIECPPSARLELEFPDEQSPYAEEGAIAHELAETRLRQALGEKVRLSPRVTRSEFYNETMEDHIATYVSFAMERINTHKAQHSDTLVMFEQRLDFSQWVPEGFGTGDVVIISDHALEIIDLKYGQGVKVDAVGNPQLRLYGLGAYSTYGMIYDIRQIHLTIVQPRLDHMSTETIGVWTLLEWAEEVIVPAAKLAYAGEGVYHPGPHCRFCRARFVCRARAEKNLELAKHDFAEPETLTLEELSDILARAEELQNWVSDVRQYALQQALAGEEIPGWKVVEGRSVRKWADEEAVKEILRGAGYTDADILRLDLKGITDIEKLLGKKRFTELLSDHIIKPPGKPTLVPETDSRPALNSAAADFSEN